MTVEVTYIPQSGAPEIRMIDGDLLKGLRALVGGYVEVASRPEGYVLLVDEEGLYKRGNVTNLIASRIAHRMLVGDAVLISAKDFD